MLNGYQFISSLLPNYFVNGLLYKAGLVAGTEVMHGINNLASTTAEHPASNSKGWHWALSRTPFPRSGVHLMGSWWKWHTKWTLMFYSYCLLFLHTQRLESSRLKFVLRSINSWLPFNLTFDCIIYHKNVPKYWFFNSSGDHDFVGERNNFNSI